MVNLVPAKCPSCGAQLELDDNMKRAECSFCNTTIIVDDAIAKYKLEVSGNVKVSGTKDYSDKLLIVKKHLKVRKYVNAKELLEKILEDDEYNLEALKEYVDLLIEYRHEFFEFLDDDMRYLMVLEDKINMLESVDDDGEYKTFIKKAKDKTTKLLEEINNKRHDELITDLYCRCYNYINLDKSKKSKRINELQQHFKIDDITTEVLSKNVRNNEMAEIEYVQGLIDKYNKNTVKVEKKTNSVQVIITAIISIIVLIFEWSYIIRDIIDSFSNFSILTPLAAIIYVIIGIGISLLVIFVSSIISRFLAKLFVKK